MVCVCVRVCGVCGVRVCGVCVHVWCAFVWCVCVVCVCMLAFEKLFGVGGWVDVWVCVYVLCVIVRVDLYSSLP